MKISVKEIRELIKEALSGCSKCKGTGQIDMGFYNRDCMDCRDSDGIELFDVVPKKQQSTHELKIRQLVEDLAHGVISLHNFVEEFQKQFHHSHIDHHDISTWIGSQIQKLTDITDNASNSDPKSDYANELMVEYMLIADQLNAELLDYISSPSNPVSIEDIIPWPVNI